MTTWSLRWRIVVETALLVAVTAAAATLYDIPGAVLVGIGAVIIASYRAGRLARSFRRITEGALRIASIDHQHRIAPEGPAELNRLARAVNRMADQMVAATRDVGQESARFESILDAMAEGVMVVAPGGEVDFANPAAVLMLGGSGPFQPGKHITSLTSNYELNDLATTCARDEKAGQAFIELAATRQYLQAVAAPMRDREENRRAVVILSDLTDLRRAETSRREFVSNASHELRTPLSAIKAAAETLQRKGGDDPETRRDFLSRIQEDVDRMETMVGEMLELSRLESGQAALVLRPIEIGRLFSAVAVRFSALAAETGVVVETRLATGLPPFDADPVKLEQALVNLVSNAFNAMPEGGTLTLSAKAGPGASVRICVSDTGHGVPAQHLPHIFERFYRTDRARSSGVGAGLGLAIVKHVAQAHGGEVTVESVAGSGASFTITLPARRESGAGSGADRQDR